MNLNKKLSNDYFLKCPLCGCDAIKHDSVFYQSHLDAFEEIPLWNTNTLHKCVGCGSNLKAKVIDPQDLFSKYEAVIED